MDKKLIKAAAIATLGAALCGGAIAAGERGSEAEAQAMAKKAVAAIKADGAEKAYKAFTEHPDGAFKDRDLYVFAIDMEGNTLAHGGNPKLVGKNAMGMKDADGNLFVKGMVEKFKTEKSGWYGPYKFTNPNSQGYEMKKSYCEQGGANILVCVGIYTTK